MPIAVAAQSLKDTPSSTQARTGRRDAADRAEDTPFSAMLNAVSLDKPNAPPHTRETRPTGIRPAREVIQKPKQRQQESPEDSGETETIVVDDASAERPDAARISVEANDAAYESLASEDMDPAEPNNAPSTDIAQDSVNEAAIAVGMPTFQIPTDDSSLEQKETTPSPRMEAITGMRPLLDSATPEPNRGDADPATMTPQSDTSEVAPRVEPPGAQANADDFVGVLDQATDKREAAAVEEPTPTPTANAMAESLPPTGVGLDMRAPSPQDAPVQSQQVATPERQFVQTNHPSIVQGIRTQLLPDGGTMRIRLSPPELGAMQVRVEVRGDMVAATFETSSDQAAHLLAHGLAQLKHTLEEQGMSVGRLQVTRAPRDEGARAGDQYGESAMKWQGFEQQQNDHRREVLRQLWHRLAHGSEPIDLFA